MQTSKDEGHCSSIKRALSVAVCCCGLWVFGVLEIRWAATFQLLGQFDRGVRRSLWASSSSCPCDRRFLSQLPIDRGGGEVITQESVVTSQLTYIQPLRSTDFIIGVCRQPLNVKEGQNCGVQTRKFGDVRLSQPTSPPVQQANLNCLYSILTKRVLADA